MKKIIILASCICLTLFQSCLKSQVDYFNQTAASRMKAALDNAKNVLVSAENGWKMEYFTASGGYNYAVKFIEDDAKGNQIDSICATSELAPSKMSGSYFRLKNDDGPVLSFDTYNDVLHYFGTPDWSNYQARGGDFEFIIISASFDEVVLKGKRSGLITRMTPIEKPETMEIYARRMADTAEGFLVVNGTGSADGTPVKVDFDLTNRNLTLTAKGEDGEWDEVNAVTTPYIVTSNGVRFEREVDFQGHTISAFKYNKVTKKLLADDEDLSFKVSDIPADYTKFSEYLGNFSFTYTDSNMPATADVTVETYDELSKIVRVKGFTEDYEGILLWYNATVGRLQFLPQYVGVYNDEFSIAAFSCDGRSISTSATFDLVPNPTPDKGFKFVTTPGQKMKANCYILMKEFQDEEGETDYEEFTEWKPNFVTPKTLVRK